MAIPYPKHDLFATRCSPFDTTKPSLQEAIPANTNANPASAGSFNPLCQHFLDMTIPRRQPHQGIRLS